MRNGEPTIEYWADYICPWCYLATDRVGYLIESHGAELAWHPFELHPEIPIEGQELPQRYRGDGPARDQLVAELNAAGLEYSARRTWSNSRAALSLSAWAADQPEWPRLHEAIYRAYWVEGADIGNEEVLRHLAEHAGIDGAPAALDSGAGQALVDDSMVRAMELTISGTPGWHFGNGMVLTGAHPRAMFDRVLDRSAGE